MISLTEHNHDTLVASCHCEGVAKAYLNAVEGWTSVPHYPVPALYAKHMEKHGGGIQGDWTYLASKAMFVDWSRGSIEVY